MPLLLLPFRLLGAHDVDVACDQLRHRVAERRAGLVRERDPALHVELLRLLVEQRDIVRLPRKTGREIAQRRIAPSGGVRLHVDRQRRSRTQILRHLVEDHACRRTVGSQYFDAVADLQDHAVVHRKHGRGLRDFVAVAWIRAHDPHLATDGLLHHLLRRQQVEVEVLLDDLHARGGQRDCLGTNARGHVLEFEPRAPDREIERAHVLDQCEVLVVDGERESLICHFCGVYRPGQSEGDCKRDSIAVHCCCSHGSCSY